jgi:hypothetical protein
MVELESIFTEALEQAMKEHTPTAAQIYRSKDTERILRNIENKAE